MNKLMLKPIETDSGSGIKMDSTATYIFDNIEYEFCEYAISKYNEIVFATNKELEDDTFLKTLNESTQTVDEIRDIILNNDEAIENINL
jgi:hypothetical protein